MCTSAALPAAALLSGNGLYKKLLVEPLVSGAAEVARLWCSLSERAQAEIRRTSINQSNDLDQRRWAALFHWNVLHRGTLAKQ